MSSHSSGAERRAVRRILRERLAALSIGYRQRAAQRVRMLIAATDWLRPGAAVGFYVAVTPELETAPLRALAARRGCRVCLPRIVSYHERRMTLCFARPVPLQINRFGIGEPPSGQPLAARALSVLFLPVLGFDSAGTRLGSGAGYYDRLLAWRLANHQHLTRSAQKPLLVGLAYDCSQLPHIAPATHDVPLDLVVTESGIHKFQRGVTA